MKKTWRRKHSPISIPPFFIITGLVFLIGWGTVSALSHTRPGFLESIFAKSTVVQTSTASASQSFFSFFKDKSDLEAKIKRLEDNELALQLQLQISSYTEEENKDLRELLGYQKDDGVLGSVLAWPPKTAYDTLLLEVGKPVSVGDLVLGRGVAPIGTIERIEGSYAYVRLFTHGGAEVQVRVGSEYIPLTMVGMGGGAAVINAPKDISVTTGDSVFFPYSGNTIMGRVGAIETDSQSPNQKLWLAFPKHFYAYTWVSVVPYQNI
ncbi:MAG: hypothetical protein ACJKSS_02105 [Patescibacteria group bacterium UBA2103]